MVLKTVSLRPVTPRRVVAAIKRAVVILRTDIDPLGHQALLRGVQHGAVVLSSTDDTIRPEFLIEQHLDQVAAARCAWIDLRLGPIETSSSSHHDSRARRSAFHYRIADQQFIIRLKPACTRGGAA